MSKGDSSLFIGTTGRLSTIKHSILSSVKNWAKSMQVILKKKSNRMAKFFNTASVVFDLKTGCFYFGMNNGIELNHARKNAILFGDPNDLVGLLPKESLNQYSINRCAEIDAINNALNDNAQLQNLCILTVHATEHSFGFPKAACENCTYALEGKIRYNFSGWIK